MNKFENIIILDVEKSDFAYLKQEYNVERIPYQYELQLLEIVKSGNIEKIKKIFLKGFIKVKCSLLYRWNILIFAEIILMFIILHLEQKQNLLISFISILIHEFSHIILTLENYLIIKMNRKKLLQLDLLQFCVELLLMQV